MAAKDNEPGSPANWYDLFSRGSRDWLRHNEKVREAVREKLPDLVMEADVLSSPGDRTLRVPVRFMEHSRFRLRDKDEQRGAGQGKVEPGDQLRSARKGQQQDQGEGREGGGTGEGEISFVLEFRIEDVLDWLWEDLQLPNLQPRDGTRIEEDSYVREGWDKRGARSRLDRRRTMKEALKRRSAQPDSDVLITNEDLRFRQLAKRKRPATDAVILFLLDVSSSMDEESRRLAKTFFFWALQGIRRQFRSIETVFIAHTEKAWEFEEKDFFRVHGEGGTRSSAALQLAREILQARYEPSRYNCYLFYATDGHNYRDDRSLALDQLVKLGPTMNFMGYAEVSSGGRPGEDTEVAAVWRGASGQGWPMGRYPMHGDSDIWPAIKAFFGSQTSKEPE